MCDIPLAAERGGAWVTVASAATSMDEELFWVAVVPLPPLPPSPPLPHLTI